MNPFQYWAAHCSILRRLNQLETNQKQMATTQSDLDAELDVLKTTISDTATRIGDGFTAFLAALAAGSTPADLTTEKAAIDADIAALKAINVPSVPAAAPAAPAA